MTMIKANNAVAILGISNLNISSKNNKVKEQSDVSSTKLVNTDIGNEEGNGFTLFILDAKLGGSDSGKPPSQKGQKDHYREIKRFCLFSCFRSRSTSNSSTNSQSSSSNRRSLQSCLPSLPSINFPRVNCPVVALPSMDLVADGCERFTSCLGTVGNGLATAAGYAGDALFFIGQSAGPVCLGLIRFVGCIARIACCLLTGGASESH